MLSRTSFLYNFARFERKCIRLKSSNGKVIHFWALLRECVESGELIPQFRPPEFIGLPGP